MDFKEWQDSVPEEITNDPLWGMKVYRHSLYLGELTWFDTSKLTKDRRTKSLGDQLIRAVGSISANISEGYSRASGKDQAKFYEYALGSARESRGWYYQGRRVLSEKVVKHRIRLIEEIIRQLMTIIPSQRGHKIKEEKTDYESTFDNIFSNVPMAGN